MLHLFCSTSTTHYYITAPSAYAESAFGSVNVTEDDDNEHTQGNLNFAPVYTYYKWEQKDPASNFTVKLDEDSSSGSDSD